MSPFADHDGGVVQDLPRSRHHPRAHQRVEAGAVVSDARHRFGSGRLLGRHSAREQESEAQHGEKCSHDVLQEKKENKPPARPIPRARARGRTKRALMAILPPPHSQWLGGEMTLRRGSVYAGGQ